MVSHTEAALGINRNIFAQLLSEGIKSRDLTFEQAAKLVSERLPLGVHLSGVSVWNYASGRFLPRRRKIFEALCETFAIDCRHDDIKEVKVDGEDLLSVQEVERLLLKDSGNGHAFMRFAAEVEWGTALQIADILFQDMVLRRAGETRDGRLREGGVRHDLPKGP
jgi:hypothetical protein